MVGVIVGSRHAELQHVMVFELCAKKLILRSIECVNQIDWCCVCVTWGQGRVLEETLNLI